MKKFLSIITFVLSTIAFFPLCAHAEQVHRIKSGEALGIIAKKYDITIEALLYENQYIKNPGLIFPGQVLVVPDVNKSVYIVKPVDTLYIIARKLALSMSILATANKLTDLNSLYVGQVLYIPEFYTVQPGDTLYKISLKYGIETSKLAQENNLQNWNSLFIGQTLIIPEHTAQSEDTGDIEKYLEPVARKFPDIFYYKGSPNTPKIALTFDDGPDANYTDQVLNILKKYHAKATFFILGKSIEGQQNVIKRIVNEAHTICNHTWSHPDLRTMNLEQISAEINRVEETLYGITGLKTALMHPPYGFVSDNNISQLSQLNYKVIKWSVDSNDWRDLNIDKILVNILPGIRDGSIVLLHDAVGDRTSTIKMLPELIETLQKQGYVLVTVDELLGEEAYK